ncbi:hypothetical protein ACHAWC_003685 [Mediolabrus comicus]
MKKRCMPMVIVSSISFFLGSTLTFLFTTTECSFRSTQLKKVSDAPASETGVVLADAADDDGTTRLEDHVGITTSHQQEDGATSEKDKQIRMVKYMQNYSYVPPTNSTDAMHTTTKIECGSAPNFTEFFGLSSKSRSANNEDKWIYEHFFKDNRIATKPKGTFVEIGGFNGMDESNSRFFENCLGWEGLLVEGQPENYEKLRNNRPLSHKMSFAPSCDAEYERVNKTVPFAIYPFLNSGLKGHAKTYDAKSHVDVPCGPFTPVLEDIFEFANRRINFFSLDVEGSEYRVLQTIDFSKVFIDVMMIEIQNNYCPRDKCEVREQVREKMTSEGYRRYEGLVPKSDIYVHPKSPFQLSSSYKAA